MSASKAKVEKRAYAIYRMGLAIDRMLAADNEVSKRRMAKWARAWGQVSERALKYRC